MLDTDYTELLWRILGFLTLILLAEAAASGLYFLTVVRRRHLCEESWNRWRDQIFRFLPAPHLTGRFLSCRGMLALPFQRRSYEFDRFFEWPHAVFAFEQDLWPSERCISLSRSR